jgi:hypothetical protein
MLLRQTTVLQSLTHPGPSERKSLSKSGSAQESDAARDLGCFLDDNEFGPRGGHPLGLEQEIA